VELLWSLLKRQMRGRNSVCPSGFLFSSSSWFADEMVEAPVAITIDEVT
jgi:hypothetical protein